MYTISENKTEFVIAVHASIAQLHKLFYPTQGNYVGTSLFVPPLSGALGQNALVNVQPVHIRTTT